MSLTEVISSALSEKSPEEIRNVCLIAHVDHGKTSFADSLVSVNAVISNRMAGRLRFMDSREDEQTRGITMKSSGISLLCGPMLVNLMDSPGHVDFSAEVTSALQLTDIALLLVDVIEGVCSQTNALLRQAVTNGQTVVLVINKLDRLCVELKMSSSEAYTHIVRLIEAVNSCISQIVCGMVLEETTWGSLEDLEHQLQFDPVKGNVLFASAIHGYAFGLEDFAEIYSEKLKIDKQILVKGLFGDFYFQPDGVKENASLKGRKNMFELFILDPLWSLHDCGLVKNDIGKLLQLSEKLGVSFKSRRVTEAFDEVMRTWMPISRACFRACARAPSAKVAINDFRLKILTGNRADHPLAEHLRQCLSSGPTIIYVVKFIHWEGRKLAICRVFSGKVTVDDTLYLHGRKIRDVSTDPITVSIRAIYMLRGRDCLSLNCVSAGNICALDADGLVQNSTLCSELVSRGIDLGVESGEPLVRVSVSPPDLNEREHLKDSLKLLAFLDPSLRVLELETGDLAMVTAGEVHLQKCLKDLEDLGFFDLDVSAPIVPFLETVVADSNVTNAQLQSHLTECHLRGDALHIALRAVPLPQEMVRVLESYSETIQLWRKGQSDEEQLELFRCKLLEVATKVLPTMKGSWWYRKSEEDIEAIMNNIWTFGPDRARANLLINAVPGYTRKSIWSKLEGETRSFDQALVSGFELFVSCGPLCNEAMRGICIIVEEWSLDDRDSVIGGQLMSAMRATCKVASEKLGLRLVAAMYRCMVSTASTALGKVHTVLAQRKAKVVNEDINEATGLFEVEALLPVVESFSFCDHLRKHSSGLASAQLEFSHWEVIDEDPYWVPSTLEEVEEFGLKGDSPNHARGYMDAIRRRKGLPTEDLIVESAEKQRNLKKNK